jgi:phage gp37-like protein
MNIKDVEDAIINRLKSSITDLQIEGFPEDFDQYQFIHPKGAILVAYSGSDYTKSAVLDRISQVQTLHFDILLISRGLRTHTGAYAYLDSIRASLTGYQPTGLSKIWLTKEEFVDEQTGIWRYSISVSVNGRNEE